MSGEWLEIVHSFSTQNKHNTATLKSSLPGAESTHSWRAVLDSFQSKTAGDEATIYEEIMLRIHLLHNARSSYALSSLSPAAKAMGRTALATFNSRAIGGPSRRMNSSTTVLQFSSLYHNHSFRRDAACRGSTITGTCYPCRDYHLCANRGRAVAVERIGSKQHHERLNQRRAPLTKSNIIVNSNNLNLGQIMTTRSYIFFETDKMKIREIFESALSFFRRSPHQDDLNQNFKNYIDTNSVQRGKKIMIRLKNNSREQIQAHIDAIQRRLFTKMRHRLRKKYHKHVHKAMSNRSSKYSHTHIFGRNKHIKKSLSKRFKVNKLKTELAVKRAVAMAMKMAKVPSSSTPSLSPLSSSTKRDLYKAQTTKFQNWRKKKQTNITNFYKYQRSMLRHNTQNIWNIIYEQLQQQHKNRYNFPLSSPSSIVPPPPLPSRTTSPSIHNQIKSILQNFIMHSKYKVTIDEPFEKTWFSNRDGSLGYPLTSRDPKSGRFVNPWNSVSTNGWKQLSDVWRWKKMRMIGYNLEHSLSGGSGSGSDCVVDGDSHNHEQSEDNSSETGPSISNNKANVKTICNTDKTTSLNHTITSTTNHDMQLTPPSSPAKIKLTWVGHATTLIQMAGYTIITDPVFSNKASPIQYFSKSEFFGVPRRLPPSFTIEDIRDAGGCIDFCVISHDHYDHLDFDSVKQLHEANLVKFWIVPLGIKNWLSEEIGIGGDRVVELEWWQSVMFKNNSCDQYFTEDNNRIRMERVMDVLEWSPSDNYDTSQNFLYGTEANKGFEKRSLEHSSKDAGVKSDHAQQNVKCNVDNEIVLTCAPAQHWSSRSPFDRNTRLWCSWAIHTKTMPPPRENSFLVNENGSGLQPQKLSFYFAGDTAYPKSFPLHRQIGDRLGPFDLSAIPIGAYKPRFFMHDSHCDPGEALKIHKDIRSKKSVAIHWGTFPLANEPYDEPPHLLEEAIKLEFAESKKGNVGVDHDRKAEIDFTAIPQGNTIESSSIESSSPILEDDVDIYESLRYTG